MTIYSVAIITLSIFIIFSFYAFAKRKLDFRYVMFWLVLSVLLIIVSSNVNLLEKIAHLLNVYYMPSLFFAAALVFVLAFIFYITIFITGITKKIVKLTQEVGLLKRKIEEYEDALRKKENHI
ncbi:MAG: DUF2304 domain-containing protein [Firmicutes bacterium]|nr:DUF2304 domain-containing protein [Bacillota bacterium]